METKAINVFDKIINRNTKAGPANAILPAKVEKPESISTFTLTAGTVIGIGAAAAITYFVKHRINTRYLRDLAECLSVDLGKKIKPSQLKSVMSPQEFLKTIPSLHEQNYMPTAENIRKGIFIADLHSHSKFSDGKLSVMEILNQAAEYGNKLNGINGKKFIFALSDHDGVEGVKEALRIIVQNPDKYKNIKFVPAAELSFNMKCSPSSQKAALLESPNPTEASELLAYCINPFSVHSKNFFENLYAKRRLGVKETIEKAKELLPEVNFSEEEYYRFFDTSGTKSCLLNQHWRIMDYLKIKNKSTQIARWINQDPQKFFEDSMASFIGKESGARNAGNFNKFLNAVGFESQNCDDYRLNRLKEAFFPFLKDGAAFSKYDNNFADIINYAKNEKAILAFAHPAYTIQNMDINTAAQDLKNLISLSDGSILFAEKFHQAYKIGNTLTLDELGKYNSILDRIGISYLGGRDNHSLNFADFNI